MDLFMKRLREGLPAEESHALVMEVEAERARERAPKTNQQRSSDPKVQYFSDLWFNQRSTATREQKDGIGIAYVSKILGLGDEDARRFAVGDSSLDHRVGMRLGTSEPHSTDVRGFWKAVADLFPGVYSPDDIDYLVGQGPYTPDSLRWQIEIWGAEDSPVLRRITVLAHAYK